MFLKADWEGLLEFLLIAYVPAIIGLVFTKDASTRYQSYKRSFTIPPWLFGVVWTALYALIGTAGFLFWDTSGADTDKPDLYNAGLALWAFQLILNAIWTPLFFGYGYIAAAAIELGILFGATVATTVLFFIINTTAGALMTPYAAWLVVALTLNIDIWIHNPEAAETTTTTTVYRAIPNKAARHQTLFPTDSTSTLSSIPNLGG